MIFWGFIINDFRIRNFWLGTTTRATKFEFAASRTVVLRVSLPPTLTGFFARSSEINNSFELLLGDDTRCEMGALTEMFPSRCSEYLCTPCEQQMLSFDFIRKGFW
jgi:hypothetical protein